GDKFITAVQLQIAEENGLNKDMVRHRVYRGMRVLDAISTEKYTPTIKKHYTDADKKLASDNGVSMDLVHQRIKRGWGKRKALSTPRLIDRKSTRLNSSHVSISYAVFCLKKKKESLKLNK